jgi:hypothetical protein
VSILKASSLGLLGGFVVELVARLAAPLRFGSASFASAFAATFTPWGLAPIALLGVYCMRATLQSGWHAVRMVLATTLIPLGWLTYESEYRAHTALAQHRWTAAALAGGLVSMATIVAVIVVGELALLVARRSRGGSRQA